jgi:hypothetical protein
MQGSINRRITNPGKKHNSYVKNNKSKKELAEWVK